MNPREHEELAEVLAALYDGENEIVNAPSDLKVPDQYVNARKRLERVLNGKEKGIPIADSVTLNDGTE